MVVITRPDSVEVRPGSVVAFTFDAGELDLAAWTEWLDGFCRKQWMR
ncbi:hypothetical protein [Streptomyces sp. NBC_01643]|nr:hypothetical protein OHB03_47385 [Streptomyces sp. NBC_01643]